MTTLPSIDCRTRFLVLVGFLYLWTIVPSPLSTGQIVSKGKFGAPEPFAPVVSRTVTPSITSANGFCGVLRRSKADCSLVFFVMTAVALVRLGTDDAFLETGSS